MKKTMKTSPSTLIGKFEVAGARVWVRRFENALTLWVEPRTVNPAFSSEMWRWKEIVGAKRKRKQFLWIVPKKKAGVALKVLSNARRAGVSVAR